MYEMFALIPSECDKSSGKNHDVANPTVHKKSY